MVTETAERVLDNLTTAVLAFDDTLRFTLINPAGEMLFQLSANKVLNRKLTELLPQSHFLAKTLKAALSRSAPFTAHGVRLHLPSGQELTVDCTVSPIIHDCGMRVLVVELTRVDRLLRFARETDMLRSQTTSRAVIKGLAHEIKNPLGGLRGAAQLLEQELPQKSLKEYTGIIIHEADRLRDLVDRMAGPNQPPNRQSINLHQILEHVCNLILVEYPQDIRIERDYDPSLPNLMADSGQLIQAVLNIFRNSVEALDGYGRIHVRTAAERQFTIGQLHHRLVLRADIEDDGPGISEDLLDSIFYPMVTNKPEGTGLGLSIANDIITKHGGLIECSSRPKKTVFSIYLPLEYKNG